MSGLIASGSPSATPLPYSHVDDIQFYSASHPAGTTIYWDGILVDGNYIFDRFDLFNPWPTVSNGINDYTGDSFLSFRHLMIANNFMATGSLQAILFDAVLDGTSQIAGNTVVDDGWGASINSVPEIAAQSGLRVCNNIAPIIVAQTNRGSTQDHAFSLGQIIYYVTNPDGTLQANPSYFGGFGWYGPTGRSNTPDAGHTSEIVEDLAALQKTFYPALRFGQVPTFAGPPFDGSLTPGSAPTMVGTLACGTPNNILGQPRPTSITVTQTVYTPTTVTTGVIPPALITPPACQTSDTGPGSNPRVIVDCNATQTITVNVPTTTTVNTAVGAQEPACSGGTVTNPDGSVAVTTCAAQTTTVQQPITYTAAGAF